MRIKLKKALQLIVIIVIGILMVATVVGFAHKSEAQAIANGPILPPEGYPKLSLSSKVVSPTLANVGEAVLTYTIEILNTGAYTAEQVTLTDTLPVGTTYNDDAASTPPSTFEFDESVGELTWQGEVGFDASVVITFSVTVSPNIEDEVLVNTAEINDPMIDEPVIVTAETQVTDSPIFEISKTSTPELPGPGKPLTYELTVTNVGQDAENTPINIADFIPTDTTFVSGSPGFVYDSTGNGAVSWDTTTDLRFGESSTFTFTVLVGDVSSGTVINNDTYMVASPEAPNVSPGEPYTTTVVDPILILSKSIFPDPPGANSEMTYTLTVLNLGSEATNVVISDTIPEGLTYEGGDGTLDGNVVSWSIPSLGTRESAQVYFTVSVGDIAGIILLNDNYCVTSTEIEGTCTPGIPVHSLLTGPVFDVTAEVDPIAHKPGGGSDPKEKITPIFTIHNIGPGNAIDAYALLTFGNISVSGAVWSVLPPGNGTVEEGPDCTVWPNCRYYTWTGDMAVGDVITITMNPQSTIGGEEWTPYTATVTVTDTLGTYTTEPATATAVGHVTHMSNLIPIKTAPPEIGPGQIMTYTIEVVDSGLSTKFTPTLTDAIPAGVTLVEDSISDGGDFYTIGDQTIVSWTLPAMGPGDNLFRSFAVTTDPDLVSGTLIVNDDYQTSVYEDWIKGIKTIVGEPVTTTIHEVGLIDSYKEVSPTWALPGTGTVLTWTVHVVNSGPNQLNDVLVSDIFPWEHSTYQRDAIASSGSVISDIVSLDWTGDVAPYSEELITFTTVVDDFYEGVLTNTATITHTSLNAPVEVTAVAYITDKPVLFISKVATPDPVLFGSTLLYKIQVTNIGNQATLLEVTDPRPVNTDYIFGSASSGGTVENNVVAWNLPVLNHGDTVMVTFQVKVLGGIYITNQDYAVTCAEGVSAYGEPVVTRVRYKGTTAWLPIIAK